MIDLNNLTVGADPEVFLVTRGANSTPQSAEGLIGGDKFHPVPMEGLAEGFMIQEDNVAAEFNIPPARTSDEFCKNIFLGLKYVSKVAQKHKLKLLIEPELDFPKEQLMTKHCQTLGCNPDFNAWIEEENPSPKAPELMRTAAGHVHFGWPKPKWPDVINVVKMFDVCVTVPSILVTKPNRRRQLYGRAGACRPKVYGVECRSADNFWLKRKSHMVQLYNNMIGMINQYNLQPTFVADMLNDNADLICQAINNHDTDIAEFLVNKFDVPHFRE